MVDYMRHVFFQILLKLRFVILSFCCFSPNMLWFWEAFYGMFLYIILVLFCRFGMLVFYIIYLVPVIKGGHFICFYDCCFSSSGILCSYIYLPLASMYIYTSKVVDFLHLLVLINVLHALTSSKLLILLCLNLLYFW